MSNPDIYVNNLPIGTIIGEHYRIEAVLGEGGFGIAYKATNTQNNQTVAIKEHFPDHFAYRIAHSTEVGVLKSHEHFEYARERFVDEGQRLSQLDHPSIVKVHEIIEENNTVYLVMDFIGAQSLEQADVARRTTLKWNKAKKLTTFKWNEAEILDILHHLLSALDYLHNNELKQGKGILHRDIKPTNIVLTAQGLPVLIDFGAARDLTLTHTNTIMGSDCYAPNEQKSRISKQLGAWTDLYALGCTMYRLMTGEIPAPCCDRAKIKNDPIIPLARRADLSHYSRKLRASIDKAMRFDYEARWQTAAEWKKVIEALQYDRLPQRSSRLPWIITLLMIATSGYVILQIPRGSDELQTAIDRVKQQLIDSQTAHAASKQELADSKAAHEAAKKQLEQKEAELSRLILSRATILWSYPQDASSSWIARHGDFIATASWDNSVELYDTASTKTIATIEHGSTVYHVAFSLDGRYLATASKDNSAKIYDTASKKIVATLSHESYVWHVAFSPDGRYLATASFDNKAKLYDIASKKTIDTIQHDGTVNHVAFTPDGCYLATASYDNSAKLYDIASKKTIATIQHGDTVNHVAFSPDGRVLATTSKDNSAKLYDIASKKPIATIDHVSYVNHAVFSPDGRYLATASDDHSAKLYDIASKKIIATIEHESYVLHVAFSPDGRFLATRADGTAVKLYGMEQGKLIKTIEHDSYVHDVVFSSDSKQLLCATQKEALATPLD